MIVIWNYIDISNKYNDTKKIKHLSLTYAKSNVLGDFLLQYLACSYERRVKCKQDSSLLYLKKRLTLDC